MARWWNDKTAGVVEEEESASFAGKL